MSIVALSVLGFLFSRTLISLVNWLSDMYQVRSDSGESGRVSVLIPARNEADNLPCLLVSLLKMKYMELEIWVCDDHSVDATPDILREFAALDPRVNWFRGESLPVGWSGKNFACFQLAQMARGTYMLFLDADVDIDASLVRKALAAMRRGNLQLLSVFPAQRMESAGEWMVVPLINWILLTMLPLPLVRHSPFPQLAAANGQMMLFQAESYRKYSWHEQVKNEHVEDIAIARLLKKRGLRMATWLGNQAVRCRMYHSGKEATRGLARSVHQFLGGNVWVLFSFWVVVVLLPILCFMVEGRAFALPFAALVLVSRLLVSSASKQSLWRNLVFHPLQMLSFSWVVWLNIYQYAKGETEWKGRKINR